MNNEKRYVDVLRMKTGSISLPELIDFIKRAKHEISLEGYIVDDKDIIISFASDHETCKVEIEIGYMNEY